MPTDDNKTPQTNSNMPPIFIEDTPPPMMQTNTQPITATEQKRDDIVNPSPVPATDASNTGSAAPVGDIVVNGNVQNVSSSTPKKKFAGGKIIATILGLFLLVGGVGAGVFLTQQDQNIAEKAGGNSCVDENNEPTGDSSCKYTDYLGNEVDPDVATRYCALVSGSCDATTNFSELRMATVRECSHTPINCPPGTVVTEEVSSRQCVPGRDVCSLGSAEKNGGCCATEPREECITVTKEVPIGGGSGWEEREVEECETVQECVRYSIVKYVCESVTCKNVTVYNAAWAPIATADLAKLKTGDNINFCVAGNAAANSYDKARFTVNGALQAETTSIRPSTKDYCQNYTIPATTKTFNVQAEIHHKTLGWK